MSNKFSIYAYGVAYASQKTAITVSSTYLRVCVCVPLSWQKFPEETLNWKCSIEQTDYMLSLFV